MDYGGSGKYSNYRVGRLLRDLSFSGKGLVSKPANPHSVILDQENDFFEESKAEILENLNSLQEITMSDNHEKQIEDLQSELAEATASKEAQDQAVAEQHAEFESKIQSLEATVAEKEATIEELNASAAATAESLKVAEEAIAAKDAEMKEKDEELKAMKKKEAMLKRKAQLEEAGFDTESAEATVSDFADVDDETFEKIVAAFHKRPVKYMLEEAAPEAEETSEEAQAEEEVAEEAAADHECSEECDDKCEEEKDSCEAGEEALEVVEEVTEAAVAEAVVEEDASENLRSVASEWIDTVLTQPNEK